MRRFTYIFSVLLSFILFASCKNNKAVKTNQTNNNQSITKYSSGLSIINYEDFTLVSVNDPWPNAKEKYTYILHKNGVKIPDSMKHFTSIQIPIKSIIATSTTHIPSLEMLEKEQTLIGFPNLNYVSSEKVRAIIDLGKIKELGSNQTLNTEVILDLQPDLIIGYGLDNNNPVLDNLQKSGQKILLNGDWNEKTALGKAEWIKLFGALYDMQDQANIIFENIEKQYLTTIELVKNQTKKPTILSGDLFEGKWYLPYGDSWGAKLFNEAGGDYLWKNTSGTGSITATFEEVFDKAQNADIWITSGQHQTLKEMQLANPHYEQFKAFQQKQIYSFSNKKGKTGGSLYYELAPNRPDIVIKDLVKIFHPELLPNHESFFFEKLQ